MPKKRLELEYPHNAQMCRLIKKFYQSGIAADEALKFVEQLPQIRDTKNAVITGVESGGGGAGIGAANGN